MVLWCRGGAVTGYVSHVSGARRRVAVSPVELVAANNPAFNISLVIADVGLMHPRV